jgi:Zn-dependent protease with chaperone function
MQFLLLFVFGLICWQNEQSQQSQVSLWPAAPDWLTPFGCALVTWGAVLLSWLAADLVTRSYCRRMTRDPWRRGPLLHGFARSRHYLTLGLLAGFLAVLYELGWGRLVEDDWTMQLRLPGAELIMIGPLLAALFLSWERCYRMEKTAFEMNHFGDRFLGKWNYLVLQLRNNLLIVVPPACLWLVQQTVALLLPSEASRTLMVTLYFAMLGLALLSLPLLLRVFLGLRPLPAGPLRQRLEETARRLRFRCGDILVWDTHRTMANALISGFLAWPRYVVLTDRLLEELTPEEIEAVFGHEVGHVRHHHMALYVLFCLSSLVLLGAAGGYVKTLAQPLLDAYLPADVDEPHTSLLTVVNVLTVGVVALYFVVVFGLLSRFCERQADLFGSHATSSQSFIAALQKVAHVNGIPQERAGWFVSWRHPSIAQRIDFVRRASEDPRLERRFHLSLRLFKVGLAMALPCLLVVVWYFVGAEKVWELVSAM